MDRSLVAVVDPDQVCRLALDLCDIASPTGEEEALSAFIVEWFKRNGLMMETNRSNAVVHSAEAALPCQH